MNQGPDDSSQASQRSSANSANLSNWLVKTLSGSHIGLAIYDHGFRYVAVNSAIAAMNGAPPEEHLGQKAPDVIGRASRLIGPRIDRVFLTGRPVYHHAFSAKLPRRTGVGHWIQDYFPLTAGGGRISHVGIFVVEVTEQRRLEAVIRHLHRSVAAGVTIDNESELSSLVRASQAQSLPVGRKPPSEVPSGSPPTADFPLDILSERELEVLRLLAQGKSHKEAASALTISEKTVETYRSRIRLKLGLSSLVELVHYAIRHGIVKP
jgi:DNA-binding CsgD family transcriptional regulator